MVESQDKYKDLSKFTISAWVKPQYTNSPKDLTILSSENSFELSLVKIQNKHVARFSIFDGYRWIPVESNMVISGNEWTQLTASYDGTTLNIFVNGKLGGSTNTFETIRYFAYGKEVIKFDYSNVRNPVLSDDLVIGAKKTQGRTIDLFSGQLDEIQFYFATTIIERTIPLLKQKQLHADLY